MLRKKVMAAMAEVDLYGVKATFEETYAATPGFFRVENT